MKLLIVRHAIAEDRAPSDKDDASRKLTKEGRRRMRRAARGLATLVPSVDLLVTSPLVRAVQTAEIVAKRIAVGEVAMRDELLPGAMPSTTLEWLRATKGASVVALVGHEPHLGRLVSWLVAGRDRGAVELKKGAACLVRIPKGARPGQGVLLWSLTPKQLRSLGR